MLDRQSVTGTVIQVVIGGQWIASKTTYYGCSFDYSKEMIFFFRAITSSLIVVVVPYIGSHSGCGDEVVALGRCDVDK